VLIAGMFMSILDLSIVNVALPTIQNQFGAATSEVQWVVTGYSLAEGVVVPVSAWLGDRFGVSRVYNLALLGSSGRSALCGLEWSLNSLVAFRVRSGEPGWDPASDHDGDLATDRAQGPARHRLGNGGELDSTDVCRATGRRSCRVHDVTTRLTGGGAV